LIALEDSIDAAIFEEAVDALGNVPKLTISGTSVCYLAQKLLTEIRDAVKNHNFTKVLSSHSELNMCV